MDIQDPTANDGGAYKCTAANDLGQSNANINLNFAGGEEKKGGPVFVGKPRIIPQDGGALIMMECRVKSPTKPTAVWYKAGEAVKESARFHANFQSEPDSTYLCQLEIRVCLEC